MGLALDRVHACVLVVYFSSQKVNPEPSWATGHALGPW